jgi:hypothetical protein
MKPTFALACIFVLGAMLSAWVVAHADDVVTTVVTPNGKPAAEAKVAVGVAGSRIHIRNGAIDDGSQTYAELTNTDEQGLLRLSPRSGLFQLVITHPVGLAFVQSNDGALPEKIELKAWARVEGTFRVGNIPMPGEPLEISSNKDMFGGGKLPLIFSDYTTSTGKDGHFVFERVSPGEGHIGRQSQFTVGGKTTEMISSCFAHIDLAAGQTMHIDLGRTGRPVVGKLEPPKGFEGKVDWHSGEIFVTLYVPNVPPPVSPPIPAQVANDPGKRNAWLTQWELTTEEGKIFAAWVQANWSSVEAAKKGPYFRAYADHNGLFRMDDVPSGDYSVTVGLYDHNNKQVAEIRDYHITVPEMDGGRSDEPLDLGTLRLEKH